MRERRWGRAPRSTRRRHVGWNGRENDRSASWRSWLTGPRGVLGARGESGREATANVGRKFCTRVGRPPSDGLENRRFGVCMFRTVRMRRGIETRAAVPRERPSSAVRRVRTTPESPSSPSVARRHHSRSRARCSPSPLAIPPPSRSGAPSRRSPLARASRPPRPSVPRARPAPARAMSPPARRVPSRRSPRTSSRR